MPRATVVRHEFVESAPTRLELATLYISVKYRAIVHLCLCGCGEKVLLKLDPSPECWSFSFDGRSISIHDSVGNVGLPCRSHYVVSRSRVLWLSPLTAAHPTAALNGRGIRFDASATTKGWRPRWLVSRRKRRKHSGVNLQSDQ
jgi:Family of unknown function (DUF6527)